MRLKNRHLVQFFADKDRSFYERGIMKLTERWQKVIEQNWQYIIDWSLFFIWINDFEKHSKNASWFFRQPIIYWKNMFRIIVLDFSICEFLFFFQSWIVLFWASCSALCIHFHKSGIHFNPHCSYQNVQRLTGYNK